MRVIGDTVEFVLPDSRIVAPSPKLVIVHDKDGKYFPKCQVFVVHWKNKPLRNPTEEEKDFIGRRFGEETFSGQVQIPSRWEKIHDLIWVRYRINKKRGHFHHPFKGTFITLDKAVGYNMYRLRLPNGCIKIDPNGYFDSP